MGMRRLKITSTDTAAASTAVAKPSGLPALVTIRQDQVKGRSTGALGILAVSGTSLD